ncbi:MAG: DUF4384 domain-containing protein [Verrucomicrobiota bacterium]
MKHSILTRLIFGVLSFVITVTGLGDVALSASATPASNELASTVLEIFKSRCVECHGKDAKDPDEFAFIDILGKLRTSEYVNLSVVQASKLYTILQSGDMPRRTVADKEAKKKKADPLSGEQTATILAWLTAGAPDVAKGTIAEGDTGTGSLQVLPVKADEPKPEVAIFRSPRELISPQMEVSAALTDIQTVAREEQSDTRYVSLVSAHNNLRIGDLQMDNLRRGVRKLLNSLSTGPRVVQFPEVGPGKTLFRIRLRELGWDVALWNKIAGSFPQSIETGVSAAFGSACQTTIPLVRAEWLAAQATHPPLYHDILRLPQNQTDLEKQLGIDLVGNLQSGEVVRSGLVSSGISQANRLIERHEMRQRGGYYWASYDFKSSSGRGNLLEFPLGPERAHLAGGQRSFQHAGGEIFFSLPNGFNAYLLTNTLGTRLDGAAPSDIVGDRNNVTGRVEISNGLSCIICHDKGIKEVSVGDAVRPLASRFTVEEQRLIERLHPPQEKIDSVIKEDTKRFALALKEANAEPLPGQPESVGALALLFTSQVSIETAAAELGLTPEQLSQRIKDQAQLFALNVSFKDGGTLLREHFLDYFGGLVARLDLGTVRGGVEPIVSIALPGRFEKPRPIPVELKTDKTTYVEGDDLVVTVKAAEAGHLRLLYQNAAGEIYTIFPNKHVVDDRIAGGVAVKVAPVANPQKAGEEVAIQIAGPNFGTEYLVAIVTDQPFTDEAALRAELSSATFAKSPLRSIEQVVTKDVRVISRPAREGGPGGSRVGFARVTLTTIKK